jgi:uncharacterized HAD superfamily protein
MNEKAYNLKIAFDIDGVIANINDQLDEFFMERWGLSAVQDQKKYIIDLNEHGIEDHEVTEAVMECMHKNSGHAKPYPTASKAMEACWMIGQRPLTFVTARPKSLESKTIKWIRNFLGPLVTHVEFAHDRDKMQFLKDNDFSHFVEDRALNANMIAENGMYCYLVDMPYNRHRDTHPRVIRVRDVGDAVDAFVAEAIHSACMTKQFGVSSEHSWVKHQGKWVQKGWLSADDLANALQT